jgi:RNA-directed DNA polymerase
VTPLDSVANIDVLRAALLRGRRKNGRPGPDGVSWRAFGAGEDELIKLREEIRAERYVPQSPATIRITHAGKTREVQVQNVRDRVVQYAVRSVLAAHYQPRIPDFVCAYVERRGERYLDARRHLAIESGLRWCACVDVERFYENIDIDLLCQEVSDDVSDARLARLIRRCLYLDGRALGLPLGHILSPPLSNIYLLPVDMQMVHHAVLRFADDWFLFGSTRDEVESLVVVLTQNLHARGLFVNEAKTRLVHEPTLADLIPALTPEA